MTANQNTNRDKLNPSQKKALGYRPYTPRVRSENEALPVTFVESRLNSIPKMEPTRPGANDHLSIKRVGVFC